MAGILFARFSCDGMRAAKKAALSDLEKTSHPFRNPDIQPFSLATRPAVPF
jgi:hypothetical protein